METWDLNSGHLAAEGISLAMMPSCFPGVLVEIPRKHGYRGVLSGATASDLGCRDVFRYSPGRKPNALALTLLRFLAQASQFHVTDTSAALNIPFLPAFSPHCNRS